MAVGHQEELLQLSCEEAAKSQTEAVEKEQQLGQLQEHVEWMAVDHDLLQQEVQLHVLGWL